MYIVLFRTAISLIDGCENTINTRTGINIDSHIPVTPITVKYLTFMFTHVDS